MLRILLRQESGCMLFLSPRGVQLGGHFMTLILSIPYDVEVDSKKQGTF